jgi:hypothetical protein
MFEDEEQEGSQGVYGDEGREDLMGNDEISPEEEAFMSGYDTEEEKKENPEDLYDKAFDEGSHQEKGGKKTTAKQKAQPKKAKKAPKKPTKKAKPKKKASKKPAKKKAKPKPKKKAKAKPKKKAPKKPAKKAKPKKKAKTKPKKKAKPAKKKKSRR